MPHYRTIKLVYFLTCAFISVTAFSSNIIHCLAKEESIIHKYKISGPLYHLNRDLLSIFVASQEIELTKLAINDVCNDMKKDLAPSVKLLKLLMVDKSKAFKIPKSQNPSLEVRNRNTIITIIKQIPAIFLQYISNLQTGLNRAHCLVDEIPSLNQYLSTYKYIETEKTREHYIFHKKQLKIVFNALTKIKDIYLRCNTKELKTLSLAEVKSTPQIHH
ncbi:hypothetical protein OAB57_03230 [Bacteriovoracaceae bacterium]|nr:hypothetical protein [Bacteriovoracaceae bacterium]